MLEKIPKLEYTTKKDRLNEMPNREVGIEIKLEEETLMQELSEKVFSVFEKNNEYPISKSMPEIVVSKTKQIRYKTKEGSTKNEFSISIRERDGAISLKTKEPKDSTSGNISSREEKEQILDYNNWSEEVEKEIKEQQAKLFGVNISSIERKKEIQKEKIKIRVEEKETKRVYSIGLVTKSDLINKKIKKLIEIKYIGRNADNPEIEKNSEEIIKNDLLNLKDFLDKNL